MFTGVVKLAQVDDYISPGQSCIQPKIMKQSEKVEKATVSLNDCLACSGCLTSAESVLVEQMSITKLMSQLKKNVDTVVHFIIAPQVVLSIARSFQLTPLTVFTELNLFFKTHFNTGLVLDLWEGIIHCHQLVLAQYLESKQKTILCSQCPGWVCYAQKTLTQNVVKLLSKIKSPQQLLANILKERNKNCMVVSIMPCYDKKLEAIRFDIEANLKELDISITTVQLLELYETVHKTKFGGPFQHKELIVDRIFQRNEGKPYCYVEDPVSNGYVEFIIKSLKGTQATKKQIKNSDFIQYEFLFNGARVKMAKCYGFRNIQKIVQAIKKGKCEYKYVQIMACPGGCYSGGGQIKVQNAKPKEIVEEMSALARPLSIPNDIENVQSSIFKSKQRFEVTYKVIEKTFSQSVMNW